jgi:hypothetical protein
VELIFLCVDTYQRWKMQEGDKEEKIGWKDILAFIISFFQLLALPILIMFGSALLLIVILSILKGI